MAMPLTKPTCAQIERTITQQLQAFFREYVGQRPSKVICQILSHGVVVILHDTLAPAERTLLDADRTESAKQLRSELHELLKPRIKELLEPIVASPVTAVLVDSDLDTGISTLTAILENLPQVRDPESIPKKSK
jgi:uncharacterized protein YbcI